MPARLATVIFLSLLLGCDGSEPDTRHWRMHTIDDNMSGADGVDLFDIDGDGDADAVVAWEEAGELILYENPGPERAHGSWGHTSIRGGLDVGKIEDARMADFDGNGLVDAVVSATEKRSRRVGVHWLTERSQMHSAASWQGSWLQPSLPYLYLKVAVGQIDGRGAKDIVAGSKADGEAAALVWYQAPDRPGAATADQWQAHVIDEIEWVDSLDIADINGDGRNDILMNYSNHLVWYENVSQESVGSSQEPAWRKHLISDSTKAYFASCALDPNAAPGSLLVVGADISNSGAGDVVVYLVGKMLDESGNWNGDWQQREIRAYQSVPRDEGESDYQIKGILCGNIDSDDRLDIVISVSGYGHGVFALMNLDDTLENQVLQLQLIAGAGRNSYKGIKHDNVLLEDLDGDGDLDVITTEENGSSGLLYRIMPGLGSRGLGLIWFENPMHRP